MSAIDHLDALERALVANGFPAMSPWWRATFARFYRAARRVAVLRVGRRGGKSSSLCRIGVLEALYGEHVTPPGDVGVVAIVSVSRDEAAQRLRTVRAILDAIGVAYKPIDGGIELLSKPIAFKVYTASVAGVSGPTCICVICDEVAKWRDADTGANPAKEVLASLRPTMATQRNARLFLSSSPLGNTDAHAEAFTAGETDHQVTAHAESWVANPSITEQETHELEPDDRIWRREYAAIPQAGVLGAFDADDVDRAFVPRADGDDVLHGPRIVVIDASSGRKDSFTWGLVGYDKPATGPAFLRFDAVDGIGGAFWRAVSGAELVSKVATFAKDRGVREVHGDQREALLLESEFAKHRIAYFIHDWTSASKPVAVEEVRRWFREKIIALPEHERLRRELHAFEERITPAGSFTFGARGSGSDDYVALLITTAMAAAAGHLPMPRDPRIPRRPWTSEPHDFGNSPHNAAWWGSSGRGF